MNDQIFLNAIRDSPGDDVLRLVYADWLEENNQPERGEVIRVQVALADPPKDWADYRALRAREAELLNRHGKTWFGPLKKLGVREWVLRRGLVERVSMPARKFLEHGEQLFAMTPVQSIKLHDTKQFVDALAACSLLTRLSELDLSGNKLRMTDVRTLLSPYLSGLRRLNLSDNPIGPGGVAAIAASPHLAGLRCLALRAVRMGFEGAQALAGHIDYPQKFARSVNLTGLVALDIRRNMIYEEGVTVLAHSPHLAGLTELSLSPISGKSSEELRYTRSLRKLTTLRISGDFSEGIPCLLESPFIKRLRVLELNGTHAWDEHVEEIAACRHLAELRHLNLGGNRIGDAGLRALASSAGMPRLCWLALNKNRITGEGVRALCDSPLVGELRELDLSSNRIHNSGAMALADCPRLTRLCGLSLSGNAITDAGAVALAGSRFLGRLEGLNLNGNPIGRKGTIALRRAAVAAGIPPRGGNDFWVDPERWGREPLGDPE